MKKLTTLAALVIGVASTSFAAGNVQWQKAPQTPWAGTLEQFEIFSPELQRDMKVNVWLPESYDGKTPRKVLYMHDAQNLYDPTSTWNRQAWCVDSVATVLERNGEMAAPIIVGVYNQGKERMSYLMPESVAKSISPQSKVDFTARCEIGMLGDEYADFLAGTLKQTVDSIYSTDPRPQSTAVMGSSMGGLASMYAMCRHPETFGGAGCVSTHVIGDFMPNEVFPAAFAAYIVENLPSSSTHRLYFDSGDQTIDANYQQYYPRFVELFQELGYGDGTLLTGLYPGAAHCEDSWMRRVHVPLTFLMK